MSVISNFENGIESEPSFDSRTYNVEGGKQNHAISILSLLRIPLKPSLNYYVGLPATGRYHQPTPNLIKSKSLKITENTARSNSK
jgi:hypothetical protein